MEIQSNSLAVRSASKTLIALFMLLCAGMVSADSIRDNELSGGGKADCFRGERGRDESLSACRIGWEFPAASTDSEVWIQRLRFNTSGHTWETTGGPHVGISGVSPDFAEGGYLYRAIACEPRVVPTSDDCAPTTAIWAPKLFERHGLIPRTVSLKDGSKLISMSALEPDNQSINLLNIEYNIALVAQLSSYVASEDLPMMTALTFDSVHRIPGGVSKWDAHMDFNVRVGYPVDPIDPFED